MADNAKLQLEDEILILREGKLYRASLNALTNVVANDDTISKLNSAIANLSATLDQLQSDDFMNGYYQKSELKSLLATNNEVASLTDADRKYVLASEAVTEANKLFSEAQLTAWRNDLFMKGVGVMNSAYRDTQYFWTRAQKTILKDEDIGDTGDIPYKYVQTMTGVDSDAGWD